MIFNFLKFRVSSHKGLDDAGISPARIKSLDKGLGDFKRTKVDRRDPIRLQDEQLIRPEGTERLEESGDCRVKCNRGDVLIGGAFDKRKNRAPEDARFRTEMQRVIGTQLIESEVQPAATAAV